MGKGADNDVGKTLDDDDASVDEGGELTYPPYTGGVVEEYGKGVDTVETTTTEATVD